MFEFLIADDDRPTSRKGAQQGAMQALLRAGALLGLLIPFLFFAFAMTAIFGARSER